MLVERRKREGEKRGGERKWGNDWENNSITGYNIMIIDEGKQILYLWSCRWKKKILGTYNVGSYVQLFICILFYSILINTIVLWGNQVLTDHLENHVIITRNAPKWCRQPPHSPTHGAPTSPCLKVRCHKYSGIPGGSISIYIIPVSPSMFESIANKHSRLPGSVWQLIAYFLCNLIHGIGAPRVPYACH